MIEWGQAPEFVEKKFRQSKSLHTKRYYEAGIRRFRQYCEEKHTTEVDEESVYGVLDGFVGWLDLQGIKPKTLTGYVHAAKKFLLFLDVRIDALLFREKVEQPRILKIEDEPLNGDGEEGPHDGEAQQEDARPGSAVPFIGDEAHREETAANAGS